MMTNGQETAYSLIMDWYKNRTSLVYRLGGPAGSGKSWLIRLIAEAVGCEKCLLMTPTGKASNNLIKSGLDSHTIHSQIYRVKRNSEEPEEGALENTVESLMQFLTREDTEYDTESAGFVLKEPNSFEQYSLFIIDEGSMVGENLLNDILSFGVPTLLVGDPNQLPPVEDKSVFTKCDYYLDEIVRQAQGSPIIWLSQQILKGNIATGTFGTSQVRKAGPTDDELRFASQVLTDTNVSRNDLNARMRPLYLDGRALLSIFSQSDKIICRTNTNLFSAEGFALTNGAQGTIKTIKHIVRKGQIIDLVMSTADLGEFRFVGTNVPQKFPAAVRPPKIEYGYAVTVHLSQGSEWDNVIFRATYRISKSSLYTAVTRAKQSVLVTLET